MRGVFPIVPTKPSRISMLRKDGNAQDVGVGSFRHVLAGRRKAENLDREASLAVDKGGAPAGDAVAPHDGCATVLEQVVAQQVGSADLPHGALCDRSGYGA